MQIASELTGQRFGLLTAIQSLGQLRPNRTHYWLCVCDCGNTVTVRCDTLTSGRKSACGLIRSNGEHVKYKKHGGYGTPEHKSWRQMIRRVGPTAPVRDQKNYFKRGITVCERWNHGEGGLSGFECFLLDMGPKPTPNHSVERVDNDGNYEPENCKWATNLEQMRNTQRTVWVEYRGQKLRLGEAVDRYGKAEFSDGRHRVR